MLVSGPSSPTRRAAHELQESQPQRPCAETAESAALPLLVPLRRWESARPRPRESITIITQLSADR